MVVKLQFVSICVFFVKLYFVFVYLCVYGDFCSTLLLCDTLAAPLKLLVCLVCTRRVISHSFLV